MSLHVSDVSEVTEVVGWFQYAVHAEYMLSAVFIWALSAPRNSQELWRLQQEMLKAGSAPGLMEAQLNAWGHSFCEAIFGKTMYELCSYYMLCYVFAISSLIFLDIPCLRGVTSTFVHLQKPSFSSFSCHI